MIGETPEVDEFAKFFRCHMKMLRGYLINIGGDPGIVDDIVQDTFLATHVHWENIRDYQKPEAYLYKVAGRLLYRHPEGRYRRAEPCAEPPVVEVSAEPARLGEPLSEALEHLTLRQRQVILLYYTYKFNDVDIAEMLSLGSGTVRRYRHDALQRLRVLLGRSYGQGGG